MVKVAKNKQPDPGKDAEIRYRDAMAELEGLLDRMDSEEVDLDDLALNVERASELIRVCREKIEQTEMQVKAIIEGLETPDAQPE